MKHKECFFINLIFIIFRFSTFGINVSRDFKINSLNNISELFHYSLYSWSEFSKFKTNNPPSLAYAVSITFKNRIYVHGGKYQNEISDHVYMFDIETRNWSQLQTYGESPGKRYGHSGAIFGNFLFIFGGHDGQLPLNTAYKLNLRSVSF